ncbi:hypothetical protein HGA91_02125 [candidate division WWE3 bacterium]|nr:hypothetical protein [candidate division WWE3 bacterium]
MSQSTEELVHPVEARRIFVRWLYERSEFQTLAQSLGQEMVRLGVQTLGSGKRPSNPALDAGVGFLRRIRACYVQTGIEATCITILFWSVQKSASLWLRSNGTFIATEFRAMATRLDELGIAKDADALDLWGQAFAGIALEVVQSQEGSHDPV